MKNNPPAPLKNPKLGRRKIEIKKIENLNNRQVMFSKRRLGLFKKASELCILTGAEIAIIVQSAAKRIYSFGHPDLEKITNRFNGENTDDENREVVGNNTAQNITPAEDSNKVRYMQMCRELEALKRQNQVIKEVGPCWWDHNVDGLDLEDLEDYAEALDEMMKRVSSRAEGLPPRRSNSFITPKEEVLSSEDVDKVEMIPGIDYGNCSILPSGFVYDPWA